MYGIIILCSKDQDWLLCHLFYEVIKCEAVDSIDFVCGVKDGAVEGSVQEPVVLQHGALLIQLPLPVEGENTLGFGFCCCSYLK